MEKAQSIDGVDSYIACANEAVPFAKIVTGFGRSDFLVGSVDPTF